MPLIELVVAENPELFSVRRFSIREALSELFTIRLWARSPLDSLDLEELVGSRASLRLDQGELGGAPHARTWTGVCNHIEQLEAEETGLSGYYVSLVPDLWLLTQRTDHRIFQHKSVPDIVDALLARWGVEARWDLARGSYPSLEYRVQYGETDYDFLCRMVEEAGITHHFDTSADATTLVFSDALHDAAPRARSPLPYLDRPNTSLGFEYVTRVRLSHDVRPGAVTLREYDFRRPSFDLTGAADKAPGAEGAYEHYRYVSGDFVVEGGASSAPVGDARSVSRRSEDAGTKYAQRSLEALRAGRRAISFDSNGLLFQPGTVFGVDRHPHAALDGSHVLVTDLAIDGAHDDTWSTSGRASFTDAAHRPAQRTKRPTVSGVQSAKVVGGDSSGGDGGGDDDEIHVDEEGRVRVKFAWDRDGTSGDDSSSWLRVSEGWAGAAFGIIALPRVGQEVLVGFFEGNPDQPVVVGRVFNGVNRVPYALPTHKTRSTWKSQSTPSSSNSPNSGGFNELMFEDMAGAELVYERAERDHRKLVKNDEAVTIGHDRKKLVKGDETEITGATRWEAVGGDRVELTQGDRTTVVAGSHQKLVGLDEQERVEGDYVLFVGQDQHVLCNDEKRESIGKDSHIRVKGSRNESIGGSRSLTAGEHHEVVRGKYLLRANEIIHIKSNTQIMLQGLSSVTFKAPGGHIKIAGDIVIQGVAVHLNCGDSPPAIVEPRPAGPAPPREAEVDVPPPPAPDDVSLDRY